MVDVVNWMGMTTEALALRTFMVNGQEVIESVEELGGAQEVLRSYLVSIGMVVFLLGGAFPPKRTLPSGISAIASFVRLGERLSFC